MSTMRTVYTNIRAARTAIKDIGRLRQIAAVLVRHGLGHVVEAWNLQDKAILGLLVEKREEEIAPRSLAERITTALQELGPTFVKLGQILSTRPDLIPQDLCDHLKLLQDDVLPITLEEARATIEASLGQPIEAVFDNFEGKPLACASIAQVHTARLKTGEEVVLKVQRPKIKATVQSDLNILYFLAKQIESTIPELRAFNPVSIAKEFDRAINRELDFTFESNSLERFERNFKSIDSVKIPILYREHSSSTLLVMERLYGHKITEAKAAGHDMDFIARETVRMLFKQVFEDGFFHGDLHPGNLLILQDGRIGLIDFGLVGRMTQTMKDQMADLLLHLVTRNNEGVARCVYDISIHTGKVDYPAFEADCVDLLEIHFANASLKEVDFGSVLRGLVEGAIRHDVRIPPDYTMFFKALMTVEGIGKIVSPDLDIVEECRPYVERLIAERYSPQRVLQATTDTLRAFARFGQQFPVTAHEFLRQIEDGRLAVGVEYPQQAQIDHAKDQRGNRLAMTAIGLALLICGTMMRNDTSATVLGLPWLTALCYLLGGTLTARVVWRITRSKRW